MFNIKGLLVIALAGFTALSAATKPDPASYSGKGRPKNFIMVIPDGFGQHSEVMARDYVHWTNNGTTFLPIDEMVIGLVRTRSSDSYVTDSAAAATAFSCGIKSYNGAIGVDDDYLPCGTVLEAAHLQGMKTGLIVTSRITHATPASYAAHVYDRDLEANIALQEIGHANPLGVTVDILMGGGRCFFTPNTTASSCRKDGIDALKLARNLGYTVFGDRAAFDRKQKLPYLGLFTEDHMSYEVDRDPTVEPSLSEMAIKGLDDLYEATEHSERGFFVMVEASRIDHAGHANDAVAHLHDILAYNDAMLAMRRWIDRHPDSPTVLISTADHECGGLTVGKELTGPPDYWYEPQHFSTARSSLGPLSKKWTAYAGTDGKGFLKTDIFGGYGVVSPTDEELARGIALKNDTSKFSLHLGKALAARLGVNWASLGHTGSDVTLYGWGVNARQLAGGRENLDVGAFVADQLELDLSSVTRKLAKNETWLKQYVQPAVIDGKRVARRSLAHHHH